MKRTWLIGALVVLAGGSAVSCGDDSSGGATEDEGETRRRVAEALTTGIEFEGGTVTLEPMPETTDEDLVIEQDDAPIELEPGVAALLPFDIENNDEDDPVVATLLQFEDAEDDEHVEVTLDEGATTAEIELDVDNGVCNELCAGSFAVKLLQALKTEGGRIGQRVARTLMLTCEEDGADATCESAAGDGDGDGDAPGDGDGDGDPNAELVGSADTLSRNARAINTALCACYDLPATCTQHKWITGDEIDCVSAAIVEDPANDSENLMALADALPGVTAMIMAGACDRLGVFQLAAPTADLQELPPAVLECDPEMDTFYPTASEDETPAP